MQPALTLLKSLLIPYFFIASVTIAMTSPALAGQALIGSAVDLELTDIDGKKYPLQQYQGKWLILNYWATWCPPCRDEIPMLVDYDNEHKNVMVFGINYEPGIEVSDLREFIDDYFVSYPTVMANRAIIEAFGNPRGLPMTVFIDPEGKVAKQYVGMLNEQLLNRITKQANKK